MSRTDNTSLIETVKTLTAELRAKNEELERVLTRAIKAELETKAIKDTLLAFEKRPIVAFLNDDQLARLIYEFKMIAQEITGNKTLVN